MYHTGMQIDDEDWKPLGACFDLEPSTFFPDPGDTKGVRKAKSICQNCTVRLHCLQEAMENEEKYGIWGGLSERQRSMLWTKMGYQVDTSYLQEAIRSYA